MKFCKVLKEIKQDSNIGIFVTGAENTWHPTRFDNFVYVIRSASVFFPAFLKIVICLDPRKELGNEKYKTKVAKLSKLFSTDSVIQINDEESF